MVSTVCPFAEPDTILLPGNKSLGPIAFSEEFKSREWDFDEQRQEACTLSNGLVEEAEP
jgi:hypothetical protein